MKPAPALALLFAAGALAVAVPTWRRPAGEPPELPAQPRSTPPIPASDLDLRELREAARPSALVPSSRGESSDARHDALVRVVSSLTRRLEAGDCDADFDRQARLAARALLERHGSPPPEDLRPLLVNPDTAVAAAVLAGHLGWTALPPATLGALGASWNDVRLEGQGEGLAEADAAFARALAVAPALYRFEAPSRRDALLGALLDPVPQRRRLARAAAASADPVDAARRLARLAASVEHDELGAERLCLALRQCLDRVASPTELDPLTLEISRQRAASWSRASRPLATRAATLQRALTRFPR